jgi:hypothetical protein
MDHIAATNSSVANTKLLPFALAAAAAAPGAYKAANGAYKDATGSNLHDDVVKSVHDMRNQALEQADGINGHLSNLVSHLPWQSKH